MNLFSVLHLTKVLTVCSFSAKQHVKKKLKFKSLTVNRRSLENIYTTCNVVSILHVVVSKQYCLLLRRGKVRSRACIRVRDTLEGITAASSTRIL